MTSLSRSFDSVAELYDEVRPRYPDSIYAAIDAALGGLDGVKVLDLAAGTGIATRALLTRGAQVVALDPGMPMVTRLRSVTPDVPVVVAQAESLPFQDDSFDLVTCATAWHWLDTAVAVGEIRRISHSGGYLALWWANHRMADDIEWERARSAVYERWHTEHGSRPPQEVRGVRPPDAADDLRQRGFEVIVDEVMTWTRRCSREQHLKMLATHSDVIMLGEGKQQFLDEIDNALAAWPMVTERLWGPLIVARL